jgi:hypothetical protein
VGRYQRGNQNPQIKEQTAQLPTEKGQRDKHRSFSNTISLDKTMKFSGLDQPRDIALVFATSPLSPHS